MMILLLLYFLFACTFTLAKAVLYYVEPIFFIAIRMSVAGSLLLAWAVVRNKIPSLSKKTVLLLVQIIFFHIYCAYIFEFWALTKVSSAKAALVYNLSPFITALLSYWFLRDSINRMTYKKWVGLAIGFAGMLPWVITQSCLSECWFSFEIIPAAALLVAVTSAAYGWIVMSILIKRYHYSPVFINGIGMFFAGMGAFITSYLIEGKPVLNVPVTFNQFAQTYVVPTMGYYYTALVLVIFYGMALILIANGICYNLYGSLLRRYSATFLSFAGFTCPIFAAMLGWFFHTEPISYSFVLPLIIIIVGLYIFYQDELSVEKQ